MQLAVVTDIITHFAGLMRVETDPMRTWQHPDGAPRPAPIGFVDCGHGSHSGHAEASNPPPTSAYLIPTATGPDDAHLRDWASHYSHLAPHRPPPLAHLPPLPPLPACSFDGMTTDGDNGAQASGLKIIWKGPDQTIIDDHQVNMLIGTTSYVDHLAGPLPIASYASVEPLIEEAYAAIPNGAPMLGGSDSAEIPFVQSYENGFAAGQSPMLTTSMQGTTVDGAMTSSDGTPLPVSLPISTFDGTIPTNENVAYGQTVVLGQDTAANAAVIIDTSAAPLTMIVQGNAYSANMIVQSNVVQNHDALAAQGPPTLASLVGADSVHNTATFEDLPNVVEGTVTGSLGQTLTVNIVNGDLYDVNAITQQNVLLNNTLYVGTPSVDHYYAVLGGDGQENALTITHDGPSYDIVVVMGNSYQANAIYQENVLSSDNTVGVAFSPTSTATDTLQAGGDTVTNQASIATIGAQGWQAESAGMLAFVQALIKSGDAATLFPGLEAYGSNVEITIVTGNYHQMNLVAQTNVVANSANALVDMTKAGTNAPETVITGVDTLSNAATIVAAHALDSQYVAGKAYETAMLVQTNLVDVHAVTNAAASPAALVPDLVAFLNAGNAADVGMPAPTTLTHDTHHSALA